VARGAHVAGILDATAAGGDDGARRDRGQGSGARDEEEGLRHPLRRARTLDAHAGRLGARPGTEAGLARHATPDRVEETRRGGEEGEGGQRFAASHPGATLELGAELLQAGGEVPACPTCGGVVKPTTVLFGEAMPAPAMEEAERRSRAADLFVVLGSSLVVYPAAYMPAHAKHAGATLVIVNLEPTPLDGQADLVIRDKAGTVMAAVLGDVRTGMGIGMQSTKAGS